MSRRAVHLLMEDLRSGSDLNESLNDYLDLIYRSAGMPAPPEPDMSAGDRAKSAALALGMETAQQTAMAVGLKASQVPSMVALGTAKTLDRVLRGAGKLPEKGVKALFRTMTGNKAKKIAKKSSAIRRSIATGSMAPHVIKAHERNIRGIIRDLSSKRISERTALDLLDAALESIEAEKMAKGAFPYNSPVFSQQYLGS